MNSITRKCNKCQQEKHYQFFSSQHKSLCLSCYGKVISGFTTTKNIPRIQPERPPSDRKIKSASGYVYLIRGGSLIKIGISTNLSRRLKSLSLTSPVDLSFVLYFPSEDARQTEIELHSRFSNKRTHGEWFSLSDQDIESIRQEFCA